MHTLSYCVSALHPKILHPSPYHFLQDTALRCSYEQAHNTQPHVRAVLARHTSHLTRRSRSLPLFLGEELACSQQAHDPIARLGPPLEQPARSIKQLQ